MTAVFELFHEAVDPVLKNQVGPSELGLEYFRGGAFLRPGDAVGLFGCVIRADRAPRRTVGQLKPTRQANGRDTRSSASQSVGLTNS